MSAIVPPWTLEQVAALNDWQQSGLVHPFTCPHRGEGRHRQHWGDLGTLAANTDGFVCPDCGYTQLWAHDFMARPGVLAAVENSRAAGSEHPQP